jgi:hypothetical protein
MFPQWTKEKERKGQTTIFKTLHRKLMINQHQPQQIIRVNTGMDFVCFYEFSDWMLELFSHVVLFVFFHHYK